MKILSSLVLTLTLIQLGAQNINEQVMKIANSYSGGGYKWSSTGVPKSIYFKDTQILAKSAEGTFCSGYTFSVAFDAMHQNQMLDDLSVDQIRWMQTHWYGSNETSAEKQCLYTLEKLGLGKEVSHSKARAGDFVQFWRNNKSGHSVIFLNWVKDDSGKITGLKYRSTQKSTNGIGDRTETVGNDPGDVNLERVYIVRIKG